MSAPRGTVLRSSCLFTAPVCQHPVEQFLGPPFFYGSRVSAPRGTVLRSSCLFTAPVCPHPVEQFLGPPSFLRLPCVSTPLNSSYVLLLVYGSRVSAPRGTVLSSSLLSTAPVCQHPVEQFLCHPSCLRLPCVSTPRNSSYVILLVYGSRVSAPRGTVLMSSFLSTAPVCQHPVEQFLCHPSCLRLPCVSTPWNSSYVILLVYGSRVSAPRGTVLMSSFLSTAPVCQHPVV